MYVHHRAYVFLNWKLLIPFVLLLAIQAQDLCFATETSPVTAVSPTDGSLWMATESDGLLRFGRNGRVLKYDVSAQSMVFDADGTLYILDISGALTRYTSVEGFSAVPSFESGVGALSESAGIPYIIKDSLLYSLSGGAPEVVRTLPFSISSASLPEFNYEAEPEPQNPSSEEKKKGSALLPLLWIALGLCLGLVLGFLLFRRRLKEEKVPAPVVVPPVEKDAPVKEATPVVKKDVTSVVEEVPVEEASAPNGIEEALKASEFGQKVWNLVLSNLSNPSYGVEQVANDLEISRIHVNRKLKAQTGYSPSAVFKFIRMNHASRLLLEGKLTIAEVARECGFASASYFSTAFKDYYKQSPSEFVSGKTPVSGKLNLQ